jgi:ribosomal protein L11 methyltransferase
VLAADLDQAAIDATAGNARANGVELARVERLDVRRDELPPADVVLANLTGPLLIALALRLPAGARRLIVSGLLGEEADRVTAAFRDAGRQVSERRDAGEWSALLLA